MTARGKLTRAAAALSAACFMLAPFAVPASAADLSVSNYDAAGIGQGVVGTFTIEPSIFTPLLQAGANYAQARINSQGGGSSYSLASPVFPGGLVVGALGCGGTPDWVQAFYPANSGCKTEAEGTLVNAGHNAGTSVGQPPLDAVLNTILDRSSTKAGEMRVTAGDGRATSSVLAQHYVLQADPKGPPLVQVGQVDVDSAQAQTGKILQSTVRVAMQDISIMNGLIKIGSLVSSATTSSDGTAGKGDGTLTFGDVTVLIGGARRQATIDNKGIRITDPAMSREQNIGLTEQIQDALLQAGITIAVGNPISVLEGSSAETSIGGLMIGFHGAVPTVRIPQELAPLLSQILNSIPTSCVSDFGDIFPPAKQVPICFGAGVLPGFGSQLSFTLNVGSVESHAVASAGFLSGGPTGGCLTCGTGGGTIPPVTPPVSPPPPAGGIPPSAPQPPAAVGRPLTGLLANLPAVALLWGGFSFFVLAMGVALGPSLRHGRAGA